MLQNFPGTVLFVSHDRYFIKQVATGILEFCVDNVKQYHCGYEEYLQERQKFFGADKNGLRRGGAGQDKSGTAQSSRGALQKGNVAAKEPTLQDVFDRKSYYNPGKIKSRLTKQLEKYEAQLAESEERMAALQLQLMDPALASDYEKLMELQNKLQEEEHRQETLLERMLETVKF